MFKLAVDEILLLHMGNIVKFILDTRGAHFSSCADIDKWVLYVTRNGVKKLTLRISNLNTYTLPPSIFKCSTLTDLELTNCVFKPPSSFLGFPNLISLDLQRTTFVPTTSFCVIKAPLLEDLSLNMCHGSQYLNIISPGLKSLYVRDSYYHLVLNCFMNCKDLRVFKLDFYKVADEKSTLEKLLISLPALEVLHLDSYFLELLSADVVPNGLPFTLNFLRHLSLCVAFDHLGQTSYALQLIKNSPNLRKLVIWVDATDDDAKAVLKYLDSPSCLERPLNKLEHVSINIYESAKAELCFVKQLLSRTPSLLRMRISQKTDIDVDIALELMRFPRASPRAELSYFPYQD
uniref:F-box/FBD/LRR-repeat protein At1g13570 n=2 Tax=Nicotiana TaxID=4085 RepID=A0A1S3Y867_TOBAC|nr:PREDICTED: F-box/FBD/LRR-repeat protein At1g13570-like [Nicotiana tabacum]XP_016448174.1 PREDICTED: F-box/FBD/LRR-repeat protein At1g13570-like [Nicotiana tabacum]XP_016448175.1 PREDICTED: F-box/FBD/LRR-repeat protein At1g13570-like [Nicotiana tabacum]